MMRIVDLRCPGCGHEVHDYFQRDASTPYPVCVAAQSCGTPMIRVYLPTRRDTVIGDEIPGGYEVKHGLCWPDGTPRTFYSRSEMERVAKEKGRYNHVEHVPSPGSDKNRFGHTVRWVSAPVISEEERLRHWHEHEELLQKGR